MSAFAFNSRRSGSGSSRGGMPKFETANLTSSDRAAESDNAVVSSEDEHDTVKQSRPSMSQPSGPKLNKTIRRSSFLSEIKSDPKRRPSITGFSPSTNTSQPTTPSAENGVAGWGFGGPLSKVPSNGSASNAWSPSASIWGSDMRSTQIGAPLVPSISHTDSSSPLGVRDTIDEIIPFSIPLHPTPKAYRSQSYSVGQMEAELEAASSMQGASRVKHKPSRLNEVEHAPTLEELNEGDDEGSDAGVRLGSPRPWDFRLLANTNKTFDPYSHANPLEYVQNKHARMLSSDGPNELDTHADEQLPGGHAEHPRFGGFGHSMSPTAHASLVRPQWQTAPTFDHIQDIPQSRRHSTTDANLERSFAPGDGRLAGGAAAPYGVEAEYRQQATDIEETMAQKDLNNRAWAQNYFAGNVPAARSQIEAIQRPLEPTNPRSNAGAYRQGPPAGIFSRPGFDTPLYIVAFKCARADIYYVQPGTGLEVNEGDLVMVEADRGYDLGTVTHARVSWSRARELKEKALDEHFRWLMMFSRHNQDLQTTTEPQTHQGLLAHKGPQERDPLRKGFGLGQHDAAYSHDIKPRMIKRRAFNYEIANLREKEGNEAKAKRSCQQKAREHGCEMEILDAEFQIDWKKLTFYFYAPEYINFNPLVTDLYKVYKVRIWMSAINPGTYPSPATKPPSSIGPGAMEGRDTPIDQGVSSINDPDPDGAIPPHLNPASVTYAEMNKEAAARNQSSQEAFHPMNPFGFRNDQKSSRPLDRPATHVNPYLSNNTNGGSWGGPNFPYDPSRTTPHLSTDSHAQATAGAQNSQFNPAVSRPPPAQNYGHMGYAMGPSGMGVPNMPYQPWNTQASMGTENRATPRALNPLSPPATFGGLGGDWVTRGFNNLNLGLNEKK